MSAANVWRSLERETGIEPATNSLEGCDSTTELLPPALIARSARNFGGASPLFSVSPLRSQLRRASPRPTLLRSQPAAASRATGSTFLLACQPKLATRAKVGGEGRIRTFEAAGATDLQSVAFDRFATSPESLVPCSASNLELAKGFEPPTS